MTKDPIASTSDLQNKIPNNIKDAYSRYLVDNKISDFGVDCEYKDNKINLTTTLQNQKYKDSSDDSKKKDQSPNNIYLDDTTSSRISLVYGLYGDAASGGCASSSIITPEEYLDSSNQIKLSKDSKNVYVHINADIGKKISDSLKKPDSGDAPMSEIYIINDINGLINRMVNDIQVSYYYHNTSQNSFLYNHSDDLHNAYYGMSSDDQKFGDDIVTGKDFETIRGFLELDDQHNGDSSFVNFINEDVKNNVGGIQSYFYRLIDGSYDKYKKKGTSDSDDPQASDHKGTIKYSGFMNKYVMGIITSDKLTTFLPEKDPTSKNKNSNNE
jgi:hypothetical protein